MLKGFKTIKIYVLILSTLLLIPIVKSQSSRDILRPGSEVIFNFDGFFVKMNLPGSSDKNEFWIKDKNSLHLSNLETLISFTTVYSDAADKVKAGSLLKKIQEKDDTITYNLQDSTGYLTGTLITKKNAIKGIDEMLNNAVIKEQIQDSANRALRWLNIFWTLLVCLISGVTLLTNWNKIFLMTGVLPEQDTIRISMWKRIYAGNTKLWSETNCDRWQKGDQSAWDVGLLGLGISVFWWFFGALIAAIWLDWQSPQFRIVGSIISILNSCYILLSIPYIQKVSTRLTNVTKQFCRPNVVITIFSLCVLIYLVFILNPKEDSLIADILDVVIDLVTGIFLGLTLQSAFFARKLKWNAYAAWVAVFFAILTQIWHALPGVEVDFKKSFLFVWVLIFLLITYKSLLIILFFQLGYSWRELQTDEEKKKLENSNNQLLEEKKKDQRDNRRKLEELEKKHADFSLRIDELESQNKSLSNAIDEKQLSNWAWDKNAVYLMLSNLTEKAIYKVFLIIPAINTFCEISLKTGSFKWLLKLAVRCRYGIDEQDMFEEITSQQGELYHKQLDNLKSEIHQQGLPKPLLEDIFKKEDGRVRLNIYRENIQFLKQHSLGNNPAWETAFSQLVTAYGLPFKEEPGAEKELKTP